VSLDLTGDVNLDDNSIGQLARGDMLIEEKMQVIGLKNLEEVKLNGLAKMYDMSVVKICQQSAVIRHVELSRCISLTDYSIKMIIESVPSLKFLDLNYIPGFKYSHFEEFSKLKPDLLIRRF